MIIFEENKIRISLLTSSLLRVERGSFTDLPTQTVQSRDLGRVKHTCDRSGKYLTIKTDDAIFRLDTRTGRVLSVTLPDGSTTANFTKGRLPGTYRTLDTANGKVRLEKGITSRSGASMLDDSKTLLIMPDGTIAKRPKCSDIYYFAYGRDYLRQLDDFFKLTGRVPLVPKFTLGNWWSRYKAYTQEEYRALMQKFIDRELPITVATIDMDWHWTDVVSRFGEDAKCQKPKCIEEALYYYLLQGWTGYSWNTELFPDHVELLEWLHERGFKVTLNVHPSQGVRFFEDAYEKMCERLGKDPKKKEIIPFDATDTEFMRAYFEILHHPLEREGVDFWWIDWQQGKRTKLKGLDPLWALNQFHSLDSAKGGARPLILSRYAGLGSHRYPLGFSGDTIVSWKSLDFQPYFTNCAANAGYTWWSHDIGGHMKGVQDDELYLRWLQYGVFSPINRLHSSNSDYMGKEPWKRRCDVCAISEDFLRLRHKLIPYLYSANYRTHTEGVPICMPMYYRYDCEDAYKVKNQYIFGSQLLVAPITRPCDKRFNLSSVDVWLPEGRWTDIFNGRTYHGGRWVKMHRDLDSIPVLAPEGAIVPMYRDSRTNDLSLSQELEIHLWRGNGSFELYEDDGESRSYESGEYAKTSFVLEESGSSLRLTITPPADSKGLLPKERVMHIKFRDVETDDLKVIVGEAPIVVQLDEVKPRKRESVDELKSEILTRVQGSNAKKNRAWKKKYPRYIREAISEFDAFE